MRLALSVGRLDFWNIPTGKQTAELTPYEECVWRAYEAIEPFGERRADLRQAVNTLTMIQSQRKTPLQFDVIANMMHKLTGYLNAETDADSGSPEDAAKQSRALFARYGL